jgi:hypothetical protein
MRDWCVSRQLWWGHRVPAFYYTLQGEAAAPAGSPSERTDHWVVAADAQEAHKKIQERHPGQTVASLDQVGPCTTQPRGSEFEANSLVSNPRLQSPHLGFDPASSTFSFLSLATIALLVAGRPAELISRKRQISYRPNWQDFKMFPDGLLLILCTGVVLPLSVDSIYKPLVGGWARLHWRGFFHKRLRRFRSCCLRC